MTNNQWLRMGLPDGYPAVKYKLNYRNVTLEDAPSDVVPILTRNRERKFFPWLGFIDVNVAKQLPGARTVKLDVTAYW